MKKKIVYDKVNARVVFEDDSNTIFYTDSFKPNSDFACSDMVIENVISMFNNGDDLSIIDEYLLDECECTQDAREIIVEGLFVVLYPHLL
jgi:hypothetical protein